MNNKSEVSRDKNNQKVANSKHKNGTKKVNPWIAILAISLGAFGMVTVEELPIGVLTLMTDEFGVTEGRMGLTVTLPGFLAAFFSLSVPMVIRKIDRRWVLMVALLLMAAGSIVSALSNVFFVLLISRFIVGASIGAFWSVAPAVAVRLAPEGQVPKAMAVLFGGSSVAVVAGVPIATFIGDMMGWRAAFLVVASVGVINAAILWMLLPKMPGLNAAITLRGIGDVLRKPLVITGVALTLLMVLAHFGGFTYIRPLLEGEAGLTASSIAPLFALMGVAGLIGNFMISGVIARSPIAAVLVVLGVLASAQVLFNIFAVGLIPAAILMMMWGLAGGAIAATTQGWINKAKPEDLEIATGMNSAAFNVGIASGALVGGTVFDVVGGGYLLYVTAGVAVLCVVISLAYRARFGSFSA